MLTPEQRYRQARTKQNIIGQRNIRLYLRDELDWLPCNDERRYMIEAIRLAYDAGRAEALRAGET